jgi:hypothetical protein
VMPEVEPAATDEAQAEVVDDESEEASEEAKA